MALRPAIEYETAMPTPVRDLTLTRQRLATWLATQLPQAENLRLSELTGPSNTGFSNDTLMLDLHHEEHGQARHESLVVRIKPTGFQVFPEYDLRRQYRVMQLLASTDVPVPELRWFEVDETVLGAPFYVMTRIDGQVPTDNPPYHVGGWVTEIAPQDRATIWWSGLEVLARIHRLDWRALGFGSVLAASEADPLARQLDEYERFLAWAARGKPQPVSEAALDWLRDHRPRGPEPLALCWGDARIGNMIFRDYRCVAVLDWEMATLANPEQDLAWWLFLDRHHSEGLDAPRLPGFPSRGDTVARYQELTGHRLRHLDYYEVFAGFRFAVIMIRVTQQMIRQGLLPPDSDFESNNLVTRLLVKMLDLPAPA
jgi:aminoglycoside phosphotransferase (APT) family kinase protein